MSNQAKKKRIFSSGTLFAYFGPREKEKEKENQEGDILYKERNEGDDTQYPEDQMNDKGLYFSALAFREEINHTNCYVGKCQHILDRFQGPVLTAKDCGAYDLKVILIHLLTGDGRIFTEP